MNDRSRYTDPTRVGMTARFAPRPQPLSAAAISVTRALIARKDAATHREGNCGVFVATVRCWPAPV
jgi:hypothetical protein